MKKYIYSSFLIAFLSGAAEAQTGNTGIGTSGPVTRLDINGAITNREGTTITASGTTATIPDLSYSQYQLSGTPTGAFTITGPTTSNGTIALVAGARMILVNTTAQIGLLNGFSIQPGSAQEFAYTNGAWVATSGGARPDYDWMKAGNQFPVSPTDTVNSIYHLGNVGINVSAPAAKLDVRSNIYPQLIVSQEGATNPAGIYGMHARFGAGGTFFGYMGTGNNPTSSSLGEAVVLAGSGKDISFYTESATQTGDATNPASSSNVNRMIIKSVTGNVGINIINPQSQLDIRGTTKIMAGTIVQTGNFWNGTSNISGFEVSTNPISGDVWVGIQRAGTVSPLHISKPGGTASGEMINFSIGGTGVGTITHNATGVQYNTTSDFRLKENISATKYGLATVKAMKVYDYTFKAAQEKNISTGVMAQELYKLYPQAIKVGGSNPDTDPWQVDYSKFTPLLIKAVQELNHTVETLEKEIAGLRSREATVAQLIEDIKELKQALSVKEKNKDLETAKTNDSLTK